MDKTFIFHIGMPKAGSKSIQQAMVSLSNELESIGISYPYDKSVYGEKFPSPLAPWSGPQADGLNYFANVSNTTALGACDWAGSIREFLSSKHLHTYVFSQENLSQCGSELNEAVFSSLLSAAQVKFVAYLRHPHTYLNSYIYQYIYGFGDVMHRERMPFVRRYLGHGYYGLLEPFSKYGDVQVRDFNDVCKTDGLVNDFFDILGCSDFFNDRLEDIDMRNISMPLTNLTAVLMCLKIEFEWTRRNWHGLQKKLVSVGRKIENRSSTSILSPTIFNAIQQCSDRDRLLLNANFGQSFDPESGVLVGPGEIQFTDDYIRRLINEEGVDLDNIESSRLKAIAAFAGQDVEEMYEQSGKIRTKRSEMMANDDVNEREKEVEIAVAKILLHLSNQESGASAGFAENRKEYVRKSRKMLRLLNGRGYSVTSS